MLEAAALRAEAPRLEGARARLAEGRRPPVGGVLQDQPDRRAVPGRFAGPRGDAVTSEASTDLADRAPLLADPREDLPHDSGLVRHDLITRLAGVLVLADVTVAVGRAAEHVDRAAVGGVLLAPATALHDLRNRPRVTS